MARMVWLMDDIRDGSGFRFIDTYRPRPFMAVTLYIHNDADPNDGPFWPSADMADKYAQKLASERIQKRIANVEKEIDELALEREGLLKQQTNEWADGEAAFYSRPVGIKNG